MFSILIALIWFASHPWLFVMIFALLFAAYIYAMQHTPDETPAERMKREAHAARMRAAELRERLMIERLNNQIIERDYKLTRNERAGIAASLDVYKLQDAEAKHPEAPDFTPDNY